jgi:hypothetical protein
VAVAGLEAERHLLVDAPLGWPTVEIRVDPRAPEREDLGLEEGTARYPDVPGVHVEVDRTTGTTTFRGAELTSDELVHPRLGMIAALYAQWLPGRMAFHAGAFVSDGRAFAVVGEREDGKSTLMAALALAGLPVVGDDTLVLDGTRCLSGVRCVDLRPDAPRHLGAEDRAATVRRGARERLVLDGPPPVGTLAGWLFLRWADDVAIRELPATEKIARLARCQRWHRRGVTDPRALLDVASLPAWELARPRDWSELPQVVERVQELAA